MTKTKTLQLFTILLWLTTLQAFAVGLQNISPQRVQELVKEGSGLWLVDVRNPIAFEQGHIEGAVNIPAGQLQVKSLPKNKTIVLADDSLGLRQARIGAEILLKKGYEKVFILEGGIPAWDAEKLPVTASWVDTLKPVTWDDLAWARSKSVPYRLYDLRNDDEKAKGPVDGATKLNGNNPDERLKSLVAELSPGKQNKGLARKLEKRLSVVVVLPNSGKNLDAMRTALKGTKADIRYLEGAYPLWAAREKEKPLSGPEVCPTCPGGSKK